MTQEELDELMYASDEDKEFYNKCVEGLPTLQGLNGNGLDKFGIPLPYGTGPHSVRCLREIVEITKPKSIFEIGFNMGFSAAMWLQLAPKAKILTCDISYKDETLMAAKIMSKRYHARFSYLNRTEAHFEEHIRLIKPTLCFIDGAHDKQSIIEDTELCLSLGTKYIAYDDWMPEYGETQEAVNEFEDKIEAIKIMGNIALFKVI